MKRIAGLVLAISLSLAAPSPAGASTGTSLAAAAAAGHPVLLVVTEPGAVGIDLARRVVGEAQKIASDASILEMDRSDKAEAEVVKRYRLESVPVPLILVIASNGVAAGGARPHLVTAGRLAAMIPSPAKAAYLKAVEEKKATFLVFARESTPDRAAAIQAAQDAVTALKGAATVVPVDLASDSEAAFVAETKVDAKSKVAVVVVYNAKGQSTATYLGAQPAATLVAAATQEIKSTCGPGGCGPNGCK